jgi:membrane-bound lytic murein transglycosylase D
MIQKASILLIGMLSIAQSAPAIGAESLDPVTSAATSDGSTPALASPQNNMEKVIAPVTAAATSDGSTPALTSLQNNMEKVIDPVTAAATSDESTPALTSLQNNMEKVIDPVTAAATSDESTPALTSPQNDVDDPAYHIPIVLNDSVETYIEYFSTLRKDVFQSWLDNSAAYLATMKDIFRGENLPEELVYVAMIESGFNPNAVSRAKAVGPWQFMPSAARQYGLKSDRWVDERRDYLKSTLAAARHFRELHDSLGSWPLVLAAYNAGMKKVRKAMRLTGSIDFWDLKESPFLLSETKSYVPKFMAVALIARDPASYGFRAPVATSLHFDVVRIRGGMDLRAAADAADSTYETIKRLNPEINGTSTPPKGLYYPLKIPKGMKKTFLVRRAAARRAALAVNSEKEFTLKTTAFHSPSHLAGTGGEVFSIRDTSFIDTKVTFAERFNEVVRFDKVEQGTAAAL